MSIPKITGREARNLLDGTTPGPWVWDQQLECVVDPPYSLADLHINAEGNGELIATAPELAKTVAWLYGSEPNEPYDEWRIDAEFGLRGHVHIADNQDGTVELVTGPYGVATYLKPDEAVEVARALLAAAEEARP